MERESGKRTTIIIATNMRESTKWIKNTEMEYLNGKVAIYIKATM
jgi:hypothetical protein